MVPPRAGGQVRVRVVAGVVQVTVGNLLAKAVVVNRNHRAGAHKGVRHHAAVQAAGRTHLGREVDLGIALDHPARTVQHHVLDDDLTCLRLVVLRRRRVVVSAATGAPTTAVAAVAIVPTLVAWVGIVLRRRRRVVGVDGEGQRPLLEGQTLAHCRVGPLGRVEQRDERLRTRFGRAVEDRPTDREVDIPSHQQRTAGVPPEIGRVLLAGNVLVTDLRDLVDEVQHCLGAAAQRRVARDRFCNGVLLLRRNAGKVDVDLGLVVADVDLDVVIRRHDAAVYVLAVDLQRTIEVARSDEGQHGRGAVGLTLRGQLRRTEVVARDAQHHREVGGVLEYQRAVVEAGVDREAIGDLPPTVVRVVAHAPVLASPCGRGDTSDGCRQRQKRRGEQPQFERTHLSFTIPPS